MMIINGMVACVLAHLVTRVIFIKKDASYIEPDITPLMLIWLDEQTPEFPPLDKAMQEPNGLLCAGGNLHVKTLLAAYKQGIFPWYSEGQPLLWWSPDPRMVLFSRDIHISTSMKKWLKKTSFTVSWNTCFKKVIEACAKDRSEGTWITTDMQQAYINLHQEGYAHSIEIWEEDQLVGGLYGPAIGQVFFGESMFSHAPNASKMALITLSRHQGFNMIDCQCHTPHLESMGATLITRKDYLSLLKQWI